MTCLTLFSIASKAAAVEPAFPPEDFELPVLAVPDPFVPIDDSSPLSPEVFFAVAPDYQPQTVSPLRTFDYDGDGIGDLVVPLVAFDESTPAVGKVKVFSGWTGTQLLELTSPEPNDLFGIAVKGVSDVTGDGKADILVGAPASSSGAVMGGRCYLYSGADGQLIATFSGTAVNGGFGLAFASLGDVTGDGLSDIAISEPFDGPGLVFMFSGADVLAGGNPQLSDIDAMSVLSGETQGNIFGFSIDVVGNIDGDDALDFLVGDPAYDEPGSDPFMDNRGRVYVYSGSDRALLGTITGNVPQSFLGYSVGSAGDFDNDGRDDAFMGAPGLPDGAGGRAFIFTTLAADAAPVNRSCVSAQMTFTPSVEGDAVFGSTVALSNDVNRDGETDLRVHAGLDADGDGIKESIRGYIYSGLDGILLFTFITSGGGGGTTPEFEGDAGDPDQLALVLGNFGMENATASDGDLDGDSFVGMSDLLIAIDTVQNEPQQALGDGEACLLLPYENEDGEMVDPCQVDENSGGGGGPTVPANPNDASSWDPCRDVTLPTEPETEADCLVTAFCAAADALKGQIHSIGQQKNTAIGANTTASNSALQAWAGPLATTTSPVISRTSPLFAAETNRRFQINQASYDGGFALVAQVGGGLVAVFGYIGFFTAEPGVGAIVGLTGVLAGTALSESAGVLAIIQHNAAGQNANFNYSVNPSRLAFLAAIIAANNTLADACEALSNHLDQAIWDLNGAFTVELLACEAALPTP